MIKIWLVSYFLTSTKEVHGPLFVEAVISPLLPLNFPDLMLHFPSLWWPHLGFAPLPPSTVHSYTWSIGNAQPASHPSIPASLHNHLSVTEHLSVSTLLRLNCTDLSVHTNSYPFSDVYQNKLWYWYGAWRYSYVLWITVNCNMNMFVLVVCDQ